MYSAVAEARLEPTLKAYLANSEVAKTAHYCAIRKSYRCNTNGHPTLMRGLLGRIETRHHMHYESNRSRRSYKTKIKGSSSAQGTLVDRQLCEAVKIPNIEIHKIRQRFHPMTRALLHYWLDTLGHTLQAAQVPVMVPFESHCMTQADVITRDTFGRLHLWEVKTGIPVGFKRTQGTIRNVGDGNVPCTKLAIWHLQLEYTRASLQRAGVVIYRAHVIQIHETRKSPLLEPIIHDQPEWVPHIQYKNTHP